MVSKQKLRFGVIGLGYWGPNFMRTINANPDSILLLGVDKDSKKINKFKNIYENTKFSTYYEGLVDNLELDYVVVSTPPETHFDICKDLLNKKINILVTKPLCLDYKEANQLYKIAKKNKCKIFIDETFIFSNQVIELKKLIQDKKFGDLTFINSNRVNLGIFQQKTNVIWDLAPHDIAIASYILDEYPENVRATAFNPLKNSSIQESYANCEYYFNKNNIILTAQNSWLSPVKSRRMVFGGTKQTIIYDHLDLEAPLKIFNQQILAKTNKGVTNYDYVVGSQLIPKINLKEPLAIEIESIVDSHRNNKKLFSDEKHAVNSVSILTSLEMSSKNNGALTKVKLLT